MLRFVVGSRYDRITRWWQMCGEMSGRLFGRRVGRKGGIDGMVELPSS